MTEGGDGRIWLDPATGLNRYFSAPRPRDLLAYASSTANDISSAAYDAAEQVLRAIGPDPSPELYRDRLEALRGRIREAYRLASDVEIVFAPSGTDLEYVALACVRSRGRRRNQCDPARRRRSRQRLHPQRARPLFRRRDRARHCGRAGDPVAGPRRRQSRPDRHSGARRATAGCGHPSEIAARMLSSIAAARAAEPAQPRPYRPRFEDRADPAVTRRARPAPVRRRAPWSSTPARRGSPATR